MIPERSKYAAEIHWGAYDLLFIQYTSANDYCIMIPYIRIYLFWLVISDY